METQTPAISGFDAEDLRVLQLFYPFAFEQTMRGIQQQIRFAHYSSAEAAMRILQSSQVWMRKASAMNDFREIDYGKECLIGAYASDTGKRLKAALEKMFQGITGEIEERFNTWYPHFENGTFLTCISEHDASEDRIGRLSMWRAYGGTTGVAVILRGTPFLAPSDALKAYTSPVAYLSHAQFQREFDRLADGIINNAEFVQSRGRDDVLANIFNAFRMATVCTKHPGFHEEKEWRVIYNPTWQQSDRITPSVEVIRGVPQIVQKIPLVDVPEEGLVGITIPDLVERVIIGPTNFPLEIREATIELLKSKGVANASERVVISDVPLRH
jgi:hypothetical protein